MELSALAFASADAVDLRVDPSVMGSVRPLRAVEPAGGPARPSPNPDSDSDSDSAETVVVHVQLRPRHSATRRCLAALTAVAARHESVPFALTGLSGDARLVRITVGVELGPRELIAKFSDEAQAAYAFVDALFTDLYDFMPVYVGEPGEAERSAAAGVLDAADQPRLRTAEPNLPAPRIPLPRTPSDLRNEVPARRAVPVPA
jgi:hypothetical protein